MSPSERFSAIEFLRRAKPRIRRKAASVGTQHTGWDILGAIEHYTDGQPAYAFEGDKGLQELVDMVMRDYPVTV